MAGGRLLSTRKMARNSSSMYCCSVPLVASSRVRKISEITLGLRDTYVPSSCFTYNHKSLDFVYLLILQFGTMDSPRNSQGVEPHLKVKSGKKQEK